MKKNSSTTYIDPTAIVDKGAKIGKGTKVWHFSHISAGAKIGENCVIGQNVYIAGTVTIGNNVRIQNNVSVYDGVIVEDNTFLGPSCVFTNVKKPRSEFPVGGKYDITHIKKGATIGANATIVCGTTIGEYAFVGAGSVVTKNLRPYSICYGNPAQQNGWVNNKAERVIRTPNAKKIDFVDLRTQYSAYEQEINSALMNAVHRGDYILGKDVNELESELAVYLQNPFVITCGNGTEALLLALKALNIKPGDEVIVPSFTFIATASMVAALGATPVFVDVEPEHYSIDLDDVEKKITSKTKAIIAVHLFGDVADLTSLKKICRKHKLYLIEDCAQSFGSEYKGKKVGTFGDIGCYSFFPAKNLGAYGDGGALTTKSLHLAKKLRMLRFHGHKKKYYSVHIGYNSRLDTVQAAILRIKLVHINEEIKKRIEAANYYDTHLNSPLIIQKPKQRELSVHSFNYYTLRVKKRDKLQSYLQTKAIPTMIYYPIPCHLQPVFINKSKNSSLHISEQLSREVLSIPMHPWLDIDTLQYICQTINSYV